MVRLRWIAHDRIENKISLHHVISEVSNIELMPDSAKCATLLENMSAYVNDIRRRTYTEWIEGVETIALACRRISDDTNITADLLMKYGFMAQNLANYDVAIKTYEKVAEMSNADLRNVAAAYNNLWGIFMEQGDADNARKMLKKARDIKSKIFDFNV